jgi:hypothetical protein
MNFEIQYSPPCRNKVKIILEKVIFKRVVTVPELQCMKSSSFQHRFSYITTRTMNSKLLYVKPLYKPRFLIKNSSTDQQISNYISRIVIVNS